MWQINMSYSRRASLCPLPLDAMAGIQECFRQIFGGEHRGWTKIVCPVKLSGIEALSKKFALAIYLDHEN